MSAKKDYLAPEFDVIRFDGADIITDSDTAGHGTTASSTDDTRLPAVR